MTREEIPPVGTTVNLKVVDHFGWLVDIGNCKIASEPYQHGWNVGGGWAPDYSERFAKLWPDNPQIPCYKVLILPYRKRRKIIMEIDDIKSLEVQND
jgi:hypothetical protein